MKKINIQYTRKSTEDEGRQVQSHEDQDKENQKMAERHGEKIERTFSDSKTGKKPYIRPDFGEMMKLIYEEKVRHLYCWRINRLARNMVEGGMIIEALQNGFIEKIITPEREYLPSDNVLLIAMDFGIAKEDIKKLSGDVKRGLNSKVDKGWRPGCAPIGYINDKYGNKGEKEIFPDPDRFDKVQMLLKEALKGTYTYMDLVRLGIKLGLTPRSRKSSTGVLSKSTVITIIHNPFYCGYFHYHGELKKGNHKSMISLEEYEKLRVLFNERSNKRKRPSIYANLYNGLFKCGECGYSITPEPPKKKLIKSTGEVKFYKYWRCTHKSTTVKCCQKCISEDDLTKQVNEYLSDLELDDAFIEWGMKWIETFSKGEIQFRQTLEEEVRKKLKDASSSLDRLSDTFFGSSNINFELLTESEFKDRKARLQNEKTLALQELENLSTRQDVFIEGIENDLQFCRELVERFNDPNELIDEKKKILAKLGRTMIIKDGNVSIESNIPFIQFKKLKNLVKENPTWIEITEETQEKDVELYNSIRTIISG